MEFRRSLTLPEAKYRYLQLHKKEREVFPEKFVIFKIKFMGKVFEIKVNNRNCIMTGLFHYDYTFAEGDVITITKNKNGIYELIVNQD
jgi:hypothetical protein